MSDRDKVIEELKELCEYLFHEYKVCYHGDEEDTYNRFLSANNALELLKEQEPVKVHHLHGTKVTMHEEIVFTDECGYCSGYLLKPWKACPICGRKVQWND